MQPYKLDYTGEEVNSAIGKVLGGQVSGGTQSDYTQNDATQPDYIKNRPGGYYQTVPGVDITWDGVIGDRPKVQSDEGMYLVKVGDEVLAAEQLVGATVVGVRGAESQSRILSEDQIMSGDGVIVARAGIVILSCSKTTVEMGGETFTLPETGTYFIYIEQGGNKMYVSSLTKPETQELVPIPGELTNIKGGYDLPTTISNQPVYSGTVPASAFGASTQAATFAEAGVTEKKYSAPITLTNPLAEGATVNGTVNGTAVSGVVAKNSAGDLNAALYTTGASEQVAVVEAGGFGGTLVCILTSDAVMVLGNPPETDMVLALTQSKESTPVQIPAKYLDLGAYVANGDKEFILASSTAGSTKKFKITVDDTGTLSATEVTT